MADINLSFSDKEEATIDSIVALLYQSSSFFEPLISDANKFEGNKEEIFSAAIDSVSFHQREREDYVIATLFGKKIETASSRKKVLLALANSPSAPDEALKQLNLSELPATPIGAITDPEVLNQLAIYKTVANNLDRLNADLIVAYNIRPVFPLIKNIPAERLQALSENLERYISYCIGLEEKILFTNLPLPKNLNDQLNEISPNLPVFKAGSTLEKINYLKDLLVIVDAIIANPPSAAGANDQQIMAVAGQALALMDARISYR